MSHERTKERIRSVGSRVNSLVLQAITAIVVLVMFAGLTFLVYLGRVDSGSLLLYAGVILGYMIHAAKQSI